MEPYLREGSLPIFECLITTEEEPVEYLKITFPLFSDDEITAILQMYPSSDVSDHPKAPCSLPMAFLARRPLIGAPS